MLYPIAINKGNSSTAHGIFIPDIEGCFSAADDYQDAFANAIEAIELHLEGLVEDGADIPLPSTIDSHIEKPEYQGMIWALVEVDVNRYLDKRKKINIGFI